MTDDTRAPLTAQEITELRAWLGGWRDGAARAAAAAERDPDSYEHAHRYVQRMAATSLRALDELEALRGVKERYVEVCARLQECVQRHGFGLAGVRVDVLVVEEVDRLVAENAKLRDARAEPEA